MFWGECVYVCISTYVSICLSVCAHSCVCVFRKDKCPSLSPLPCFLLTGSLTELEVDHLGSIG